MGVIMGVIMGVCTGCGRHTTAGGSESGIIPRVPGVSGIVTSVPRSQESAGCIGDNQSGGKMGNIIASSFIEPKIHFSTLEVVLLCGMNGPGHQFTNHRGKIDWVHSIGVTN